jgi:hypothetical protein
MGNCFWIVLIYLAAVHDSDNRLNKTGGKKHEAAVNRVGRNGIAG